MRKQSCMRHRGVVASMFAAIVVCLAAPAAQAVDVLWDNSTGDGNWNTPGNWSTDTVPVAPDDAVFVDPLAGPATINADIPRARDIRFGTDNTVGSGTVNQTAGNAVIDGWVRMGITTGSSGTYNLSGGRLEPSSMRIAEFAGTTATVNVTGGTLFERETGTPTDNGQWTRIGQGGVATFNLSNGLVSFDQRTLIGTDDTSDGSSVTQTGGTFEVRRGELVVGDAGLGASYTISGGTLRTLAPENGNTDTSGNITVGQWDTSNGVLNVSGAGTVVEAAAQMNLADGRVEFVSTGTVNQTGGTVRVGTAGAGNLNLARTASGVAVYNLSGGVLDLTGGDIVRGAGTATFNMTGGELRNVGSVNFPLTQAGGTFAVGTGTGSTTIGGDFTQNVGSILQIDLGDGGATPLVVNGLTTLLGSLDLTNVGGLAVGDRITLIQNDLTDAIVGGFGRTEGSLFTEDGRQFRISFVGGDGNDVTVTVIPEPAALGLAGLALGGLLLRRRRTT